MKIGWLYFCKIVYNPRKSSRKGTSINYVIKRNMTKEVQISYNSIIRVPHLRALCLGTLDALCQRKALVWQTFQKTLHHMHTLQKTTVQLQHDCSSQQVDILECNYETDMTSLRFSYIQWV